MASWVSSFATYVAIVAEAHPERVGDMLAYMRLIVWEASKFGGTGWLTYDAVFRRNQEGSSSPWNYLDASLHQVYIASQRDRMVFPCNHCQGFDHTAADCAVAAILPKTLNTPFDTSPTTPDRMPGKGKCPSPYSCQRPVCASWNAGHCHYPGKCSCAHVCANCYGSHPSLACKERAYSATPMKPAPGTTK